MTNNQAPTTGKTQTTGFPHFRFKLNRLNKKIREIALFKVYKLFFKPNSFPTKEKQILAVEKPSDVIKIIELDFQVFVFILYCNLSHHNTLKRVILITLTADGYMLHTTMSNKIYRKHILEIKTCWHIVRI